MSSTPRVRSQASPAEQDGSEAKSDSPQNDTEKPERDFGDSAGYGTGGSALDYHEVLGENAPREGGPSSPTAPEPEG
jgi:hypothetical protein